MPSAMNPERITPPPVETDQTPLKRRIAEMREMLAASRGENTAEALRQLRAAFPDIPLLARIQALAASRH
jgi:hypothetical protein